MSSKDRFESGRFLSGRFAAGRWRGLGVDLSVEPDPNATWPYTQPRTFGTLVGQRYGSFNKLVTTTGPDFMHGSLETWLSLDGEIKVIPYVSGDVGVKPHLGGRVEVNK